MCIISKCHEVITLVALMLIYCKNGFNEKGEKVQDKGQYITVDVDLETPIALHLRGGYILPTQQPANNTHYR